LNIQGIFLLVFTLLKSNRRTYSHKWIIFNNYRIFC